MFPQNEIRNCNRILELIEEVRKSNLKTGLGDSGLKGSCDIVDVFISDASQKIMAARTRLNDMRPLGVASEEICDDPVFGNRPKVAGPRVKVPTKKMSR